MRIIKDPDATLPYAWDWSPWLGADTIATATVLPVDGLTVGPVSHTDGIVSVWLSGGVAGQTYAVTCRVTTAAGLVDDRTITVKVANR